MGSQQEQEGFILRSVAPGLVLNTGSHYVALAGLELAI